MRQQLFKDILHYARNERAMEVDKLSNEELHRAAAVLRLEWVYRTTKQDNHKRLKEITAELVRRSLSRQRG